MAHSMTLLSCGCFIQGRAFHCYGGCVEHDKACTAACDCCGRRIEFDLLDAKPTMTRWLRVIRFFRGQEFMLRHAADRGYDFDRVECQRCYGPGYIAMEG